MKSVYSAMALCAVLSAGTVMSALPAAAAEASEQVLNVYKTTSQLLWTVLLPPSTKQENSSCMMHPSLCSVLKTERP